MSARPKQTGNCYVLSSAELEHPLDPDIFDQTDLNKKSHQTDHKATTPGRAPVAFIKLGNHSGVLKHYYRGGLIAKITNDLFIRTGLKHSRAFAEYHLLEWMKNQNLPVPEPLGARVCVHGLLYTCDLITREIQNTDTLAEKITNQPLDEKHWRKVGATIKQLHDHKVWHSDLNATNILIDENGRITLIDFDKCRCRHDNGWQDKNIARLKRSLDKLTASGSTGYFSPVDWQSLLDGYQR